MEKKTSNVFFATAVTISLIGNIALIWQLKEEQETNAYRVEKAAQNASEGAEKIFSQRAAEIDQLKQTVKEKDATIAQLKDQNGLKAKEEVTQAQLETAEMFAKVAIDKSMDSAETADKLKEIASKEVIQKLSPDEADHQHDTYENYSFTLGEVQTYTQPVTEEGKQSLLVLVDYTIGNPQFQDVKPQTIKGGVTLTEQEIDGKWQVTDFRYFTRQ